MVAVGTALVGVGVGVLGVQLAVAPTGRRKILVALAAIVVLAVAGVFFLRQTHRGGGEAAGVKRVAVLPFENIGSDLKWDRFADGITEDIITDLSKVSGLFVVARHTAKWMSLNLNVAVCIEHAGAESISRARAGQRWRDTGERGVGALRVAEREIERQLTQPFPAYGAFVPFRFFARPEATELVLQHRS